MTTANRAERFRSAGSQRSKEASGRRSAHHFHKFVSRRRIGSMTHATVFFRVTGRRGGGSTPPRPARGQHYRAPRGRRTT